MAIVTRCFLIVLLSVIYSFQSFADEFLWQSGSNLFIKLESQDKSKKGSTPPNSHPVELNEKDIAEEIRRLQLLEDKISFEDWKVAIEKSSKNQVKTWIYMF